MQRSRKPTHAAISQLFASVLPLKENDVPRLYHVPRHPRYNADVAVVDRVVLSVTPTPGVYSSIGYTYSTTPSDANVQTERPPRGPRPRRTLCFLHRPFGLDRRAVRRGTLVLSSHTSFDEVLTVGWNPHLAERLGMNVGRSVCIQGYKGKAGWDPDRKIGIIGQVSQQREMLVRRTEHEFGPAELAQEGPSDEIHVVAIMNAFNEEQVERAIDIAKQEGWIASDDDGRNLLYLTGQPRVAGLEAAEARGISVVCVGHRAAEDWGIRYMASRLRAAYPDISVEEVYEEEVPVIREPRALPFEKADLKASISTDAVE